MVVGSPSFPLSPSIVLAWYDAKTHFTDGISIQKLVEDLVRVPIDRRLAAGSYRDPTIGCDALQWCELCLYR